MDPVATRHRLGFAVKVLGDGGLPSHDTRRWQSQPHLRVSIERLRAVLDYLEAHDIRMYRMATALAPYASHPDLPQFHHQIDECAEQLDEVGRLAAARQHQALDPPGSVHGAEFRGPRRAGRCGCGARGPGGPARCDAPTARGGRRPSRRRGRRGRPPRQTASSKASSDSPRAPARGSCSRTMTGRSPSSTCCPSRVAAPCPSCGTSSITTASTRPAYPTNEALVLALDTWPSGVVPKIHYSSPRLDVEERKQREGRPRSNSRLVLPQPRAHADLVDPVGFEAFLRRHGREARLRHHARGQGQGPGSSCGYAISWQAAAS